MLFVNLIFITVVAIAFYHWYGRIWKLARDYKRCVKTVKGIPCVTHHWFFGHGRYFTADKEGFKRELESIESCPKSTQRWFGPLRCVVMVYHPDICKTLLSLKDGKTGFIYNLFRPWIGDGLLLSNGKKWLRNRRLLTPTFHFDALRRYVPCINDAALELMKKWKSDQKGTPRHVEMFHDVSLMTLDSLLRCLFSKTSGCESGENRRYVTAVSCITRLTAGRIRKPWYHYDFIYFLTPAGQKYKNELKVAHKFTEDAIRERSEGLKRQNNNRAAIDFLDVLLMSKDEEGIGLSHREIRDELDTFVFEGHDTVTSGLSWAFYNLALYPDYQERCREEVVRVLKGGNDVKWEHLPKFQYLTNFIKESMRLFPPVVEIRKTLNKQVEFPSGFESHPNISRVPSAESKIFPKETIMGLRIFLLHRHPAIWKNPNEFDPERFNPENIAQRSPHAYVPFSAGPRNCIGQNFAMNEMKIVLALAVSMFRFSIDHSVPQPEMEASVVLHSSTGIHLIVETLGTRDCKR